MNKSIAAVIHSVDPDLPMADIRTMDRVLNNRWGETASRCLLELRICSFCAWRRLESTAS